MQRLWNYTRVICKRKNILGSIINCLEKKKKKKVQRHRCRQHGNKPMRAPHSGGGRAFWPHFPATTDSWSLIRPSPSSMVSRDSRLSSTVTAESDGSSVWWENEKKDKKTKTKQVRWGQMTLKRLSAASGLGDLTLNWTRQVGTDILLTESEPAIMSTRQSSSFSLGRETTHKHTRTDCSRV